MTVQPYREAVDGLRQAAALGGNVLICGEPGAGHARLARAIHLASESLQGDELNWLPASGHDAEKVVASRPIVSVDCSRSRDVEGRLFGPGLRRVASEGAEAERVEAGSALHEALQGTLIIRHLPDLPRRAQARLARILRDDEVEVVSTGPAQALHGNIRAIATVEAVPPADGLKQVQPELLKRLSSTVIDLPALRERRHEIPALAERLLGQACEIFGESTKTFSRHAIELMSALEWRGNIDELSDCVWSLATNTPTAQIQMADVLARVRLEGRTAFPFGGTLKEAKARFEREYVAHVLARHDDQMAAAARALGIQRTNLYRKVRQLSVERRKLSSDRT